MHQVVQEDLEAVIAAPLEWERFRGKTILVSGGNGFLPAYMVETLLLLNTARQMDCHVICLVRNLDKAQARFSSYLGNSNLSFIVGDISCPVEISRRCDFIIHAASQASPKYYGIDPVGTMTANLLGTAQLLEFARQWRSEGFLFFSSGEVYGQVPAGKIPTRESDYGYIDILNPRSCYAESKRAAETLVVSYAAQHQVPCVIVRPFHTYGPGMSLEDGRVYADFVNDLVKRRDISLHSDGKAVRAFCYLSDATLGFFTILLKGETGQAYNVGNPSAAISIGELAEVVSGLFPAFGLKVNRFGCSAENYMPSPISINSPNIDRISTLGWSPVYGVAEGFRRTVQAFINA
jgi:UDP-glucuronate decarboxylase